MKNEIQKSISNIITPKVVGFSKEQFQLLMMSEEDIENERLHVECELFDRKREWLSGFEMRC